MAQWQILKAGKAQPEPWFDDGVLAIPGDADFTTEHVVAEMKRLKGDSYSYVGRSTVTSDRMEEKLTSRVDAIVNDEDIPINDPEVARAIVLADLGLKEA